MAITAEGVHKIYGTGDVKTKALNNVSLTINDSDFAVILGPSGSGKSTLLNVMSGLDSLDKGSISIDEYDIHTMNEKALTLFRRHHLGFIFQQHNLLQTLTVKENILIGARLVDDPLDIDKLIDDVGLTKHKDKYPFQLSGGEQQRVSIARALVKHPKILFCDEPTGSLDEDTGKSILGLLQDLNETYDTTIVLITHNESIAHLATRIIKMNSGKIASIDENKPEKAETIHWNE
ncbi:MAG: ABC transporter ATP-binding protein [Bacillota bacterium]